MSRKDIIIISVLVNAGLLIVLFASAIQSQPPKAIELVATPATMKEEMALPVASAKKQQPIIDEVDYALSRYSQNALAASALQETSILPVETAKAANSSSFAQDLKSIAQLEESSAAQKPLIQTLVAPVVPASKTGPDFFEIKVKKGDVLEKIARHHHTTVAELMKVNKLTNANLRIGQVLRIPNRAIKKAEVSAISLSSDSAQASGTAPQYYTVKKGDSPWTIAIKNHIKVEHLLKLNNMTQEQAKHLKPGDQLRIQ